MIKKTTTVTVEEFEDAVSTNQTLLTIVLDESGSMGVVREATIEAFNNCIHDLKDKHMGEAVKVTLQTFDTRGLRYRFEGKPLSEMTDLTKADYQPNAGTPLYDAIMDGIKKTEKIRSSEGVFFVIQTDGEENSSHKHDRADVFAKIEEKKKDGWVFMFLGANQDAWVAGGAIGIMAGSTYSYDNTACGTARASSTLSASIGSYHFGLPVEKKQMVDDIASVTGGETDVRGKDDSDDTTSTDK